MLSRLKNFIQAWRRLPRQLAAMQKQLDRMEDKLWRLEGGMEAAGQLDRKSLLQQRNLDFKKLTLQESFDYIYLHRLWGRGTPMYSGPGSYGEWAEKTISVVGDFIREQGIRSVTDLGCGDFNVGSQLCPLVETYHALDISSEIIRLDRERFPHLDNVTFQTANACSDPLPAADLALIRQVLQHIPNAQVEEVLQNVERTGFKYALVVEHLPTPGEMTKPNVDIPQASAGIRPYSGVCIDEPPFSRPARRLASFPGKDGELVIYLWAPGKRAPADGRLNK
jgi:SAM-dependent methyltransferase